MAHGTTHAGGTPATQALARAGVSYTEHVYTHDDRAPSYGLEAAAELGVEPERVFKTLVLDLDGGGGIGLGVAIIPVDARVDLKAGARLLDAKKATMAEPAVAERATGYVVGGISPFGQKRALPTVLDASASAHAGILVSGGRRGFDVEVAPDDLVRMLDARVGTVARETVR